MDLHLFAETGPAFSPAVKHAARQEASAALNFCV
jgi:hypothetical protein